MTKPGAFTIDARVEEARAGRLQTAHGEIETPVFMPVGTAGTVKAMDPEELRSIGFPIVLGNAFHLEMRPGAKAVRDLGGLHRFMGWDGAILTDSGGYQVFSMADSRKIDEGGVAFLSPVDGSHQFFTPERSIEIQRDLGSDIVMAFDECIPYPSDYDYTRKSTERTLRWLDRAKQIELSEGRLLYGIVQGGSFADLRRMSARATVDADLPGYAVGGLSVGEPKPQMLEMLETAVAELPREKPVYAMGVGTPGDFVEFIDRGVDMFDCVQPTRHARNGQLFTSRGMLNVRNARFRDDPEPPDASCDCPLCRRFSMAYMRHLFTSREILAMRLMTWHNLAWFRRFLTACRMAILNQRWSSFRNSWRDEWFAEE